MIDRTKNLLITLSVLVIVLNVVLLFVLIPELSSRLTLSHNQNAYADGYDQLADNLAQGNGYRFYPDTAHTLLREPGYPIFLAGIYLFLGNRFPLVMLANMLLALGTAWIMTRIALKVSRSQVVILGTPLLFLFHPGILIAESRGGVEILFAFLVALFVSSLYRAIERNRPLDYVLSGAVLGVAVLAKSTLLLFPFVLLAYLLIYARQRNFQTTICLKVALMLIAMCVVLSPWIVRNYLLTGQFIPTASVLGVSAHAGQYIHAHLSSDKSWTEVDREAARERRRLAQQHGYPFKDVTDAYYQYFYSSEDEVNFSNDLLKEVIREYLRSPTLLIRNSVSNLFNLWFRGKTWSSTRMNMVIQLPFLILALMGTVLSVRNRQFNSIAPLILLVIYFVAVHTLILAQARYSVPLIPFLSIFACITLATVRRIVGNLFSRTYDGSPRPSAA